MVNRECLGCGGRGRVAGERGSPVTRLFLRVATPASRTHVCASASMVAPDIWALPRLSAGRALTRLAAGFQVLPIMAHERCHVISAGVTPPWVLVQAAQTACLQRRRYRQVQLARRDR